MGAHGHEMSAKEMYLTHTANRHPFHVLPHSPWPLLAGMGAFVTMLGEGGEWALGARRRGRALGWRAMSRCRPDA